MLAPVIDLYRALDVAKLFRADAAFAISERYELFEAKGYRYAIRLPANEVLHREITHLIRRSEVDTSGTSTDMFARLG